MVDVVLEDWMSEGTGPLGVLHLVVVSLLVHFVAEETDRIPGDRSHEGIVQSYNGIIS